MDRRINVTGDEYDAAFRARAASGADVHGEADFVESLGVRSVLDAGCGTGRVAIELGRRGLEVVGVDIDATMLDTARRKAPNITWIQQNLSSLRVPGSAGDGGGAPRLFDAAVMAGNVMIFVSPGTEASVVGAVVAHLSPGGLLVAGFQLNGRLTLPAYDAMCERAGLRLEERWATWDRSPWCAEGGYAVSVHRAAG